MPQTFPFPSNPYHAHPDQEPFQLASNGNITPRSKLSEPAESTVVTITPPRSSSRITSAPSTPATALLQHHQPSSSLPSSAVGVSHSHSPKSK